MHKIATFNANSIRSRLTTVLDWLTRHRPLALAIQETKVQDADFPASALRENGWHVAYRGEKSYNGVAIICREQPQEIEFGFDDGEPDDSTRLMRIRLGSLHLVNTYVPQGRSIDHPMYAYKLDWLARLRKYFARRFSPSQAILWVGDINVAPTEIDVYRPETKRNHVCFHADARKAFADTMDWGFEDVFRLFNPEPGHYSFFDYRQPQSTQRNRGWRIDHILATKPLARRCLASAIDIEPRLAPKPSDHTFVWADFVYEPVDFISAASGGTLE